jgi:CheY-like chemotaxis protein
MKRSLDWDDLLRNCDFEMTACEVRSMLKMWEKEATATGEKPHYNPEFLAVLYPFLENPSFDTAVSLLEVAPSTYSLFERCSQGGQFYEMNHFLKQEITPQGNAVPEKEPERESEHEPTLEELRARLRELELEEALVQREVTSETARRSSTGSELKAAFLEAARPDAPAPPGWWVLPVLGIVMSLFVLGFNTAMGAVCLILTSSFFGVCWIRARRNRAKRARPSAGEMNASGRSGTAVSPRQAVRILVVDDEEAISENICATLRSAGYESQAVVGVMEALDLLESGEKFDLLISGVLRLPIDGLALLKCTKENFPHIPVMIAAARSDISVTVACFRSGADEYITLPAEPARLLATVSRALKHEN